jgi:hypothetical protein
VTNDTNQRVALVFRGDRVPRDASSLENSRLAPVVAALADVGLSGEAAVFDEAWADEFLKQLLGVRAALVWVDPVTGNRDRSDLDIALRRAADDGVLISAHPDVILKMGTKEILYQTRHLGWGSDVCLHRSLAEFEAAFPGCLRSGPRVLKQYRGNGGIGVWKVALAPRLPVDHTTPILSTPVLVQSARMRDDSVEEVALGEFIARCAKYFTYSSGDGRIINQAFQPRITEGIIRCYLVQHEVVGFARQLPDPAQPLETVFGLPSAKTMYGPDEAAFSALRQKVEREWVPGMQARLDIHDGSLPLLWDADFLFGPKDSSGADSYVLSEINVSAVAPFPEQAVSKLASAVRDALG